MKRVYVIYAFLLSVFALYSYALLDPNLTLINSPLWYAFREPLVQLGYHQRQASSVMYIILLLGMFGFHWYWVTHYKQISLRLLALMIGGILFFSYPFLSHDLFNYIFDAKILTFYGQNPYLHSPAEFAGDEWLRFMHWVHRPYPYGPVFLFVSVIPSFLAMGKFVLNFFFFKAVFILFYFLAVYVLQKMDHKWGVLFATHPLVLIEGLVNTHNDLISVSIVLLGLYFVLYHNKQVVGRLLIFLSIGVKYMSFPYLFLMNKNNKSHYLVIALNIVLLLYMLFARELFPWYFLGLFGIIPLFPRFIEQSHLFSLGLLLSYYPFIRTGEWDLGVKYVVLGTFLLLNICYAFFKTKKSGS